MSKVITAPVWKKEAHWFNWTLLEAQLTFKNTTQEHLQSHQWPVRLCFERQKQQVRNTKLCTVKMNALQKLILLEKESYAKYEIRAHLSLMWKILEIKRSRISKIKIILKTEFSLQQVWIEERAISLPAKNDRVELR